MIEINLIPQELKVKTKKFGISPDYFIYFVPLVFGVLICIHIYLSILSIIDGHKFRALNNKWQGLGSERKILEDFKNEHEVLSADVKITQQLISQRLNWSEKLNRLSLDLPSGIWFNEISFKSKDFLLMGSVVSLQKEEMNLINRLISSLKADTAFFKDFYSIELSSVQRRVIGGYDIVDFILVGRLK